LRAKRSNPDPKVDRFTTFAMTVPLPDKTMLVT
jgi:hypothetical protein